MKPNGSYPSVNDNYSRPGPGEAARAAGEGRSPSGWRSPAGADLRYIESFGAEGEAPAWTSRAFPYAGFYVMRSDWSAEARYLVFDGGRSAGGHNHVDKLSFELYAYGNTLVTDSGCGGPWASAWRSEYFVGPAGHNTIMVGWPRPGGGTPPSSRSPALRGRTAWHEIAPEPLPNTWVSGRRFDCVRSRYEDGYAAYGSEQSRRRGFAYESKRVDGVERMQPWTRSQGEDLQVPPHKRVFVDHERRILFVKPDYWILSDRLLGRGRPQGRVPVPLPGPRPRPASSRRNGSVRTVNGRAGLVILPAPGPELEARIVKGQEEPPAGMGPGRLGPASALAGGHLLGGGGAAAGLGHGAVSAPGGTAPRRCRWSGCRWRKRGSRSPPGRPPLYAYTSTDRRDWFFTSHERRALRTAGPLVSDGEVVARALRRRRPPP